MTVFQVVSSFQVLGSKRGIHFCLASMRATLTAHFIVVGLSNVTTENIVVSLKRTNLFSVHVIQSYLYLNSFEGRSHSSEKRFCFVKSARLSFHPRGKLVIFYIGGWVSGEICRENSSLLKSDKNGRHFTLRSTYVFDYVGYGYRR
jgi:hypothetical protein